MWSWQRWATWVVATAAAETAGYAAAAVLFGRPYGALLAGVAEGTCLGLVQGLALRRLLGRFPVAAWWLVTAAAATAGWAGTAAATSGGAADSGAAEPGLALTALLGAALGTAMGVALGGLQWLVLRGRVAHAALWIPLSAAAWALGMVPAMVVATAPTGPVPVGELLLLGALGGLLMGAAVGAVTGVLVGGWTPLHTPGDRRLELS